MNGKQKRKEAEEVLDRALGTIHSLGFNVVQKIAYEDGLLPYIKVEWGLIPTPRRKRSERKRPSRVLLGENNSQG